MIYATHRLYDCMHCVTTFQVVETIDGCVASIYDFDGEKHSMQWYDAIVLSSNNQKSCFFKSIADVLEYLQSDDSNIHLYAYGVTFEDEGCMLSHLA